jgi:hypothetical protein
VGCRRTSLSRRWEAPARLGVVCVRGDPSAQLFFASLHFRVVSLDVLARKADELFVVGSLQVMATWTLDCAHVYLAFL